MTRVRRARDQEHARGDQQYTSSQAARISGVPFFTVDYWDRTRFLEPTLAKSGGRGRGRERCYSYHDIVRLRVARELRDQKVSLQTLRHVVKKLATCGPELATASYVVVGQQVELAVDATELAGLVSRRRRNTFGVLLDLREILPALREREQKYRKPRPAGSKAAPR